MYLTSQHIHRRSFACLVGFALRQNPSEHHSTAGSLSAAPSAGLLLISSRASRLPHITTNQRYDTGTKVMLNICHRRRAATLQILWRQQKAVECDVQDHVLCSAVFFRAFFPVSYLQHHTHTRFVCSIFFGHAVLRARMPFFPPFEMIFFLFPSTSDFVRFNLAPRAFWFPRNISSFGVYKSEQIPAARWLSVVQRWPTTHPSQTFEPFYSICFAHGGLLS